MNVEIRHRLRMLGSRLTLHNVSDVTFLSITAPLIGAVPIDRCPASYALGLTLHTNTIMFHATEFERPSDFGIAAGKVIEYPSKSHKKSET